MAEFIDRDAAKLALARAFAFHSYAGGTACSVIDEIPAADVRPVVKARWEKVMEQPYFRKHYHVVACSACHKRGNQGWNFCPNCGADMREGS